MCWDVLSLDVLPQARTGGSQTHEEEETGQDEEDCGEEYVDDHRDGGHWEGVLQLILNVKFIWFIFLSSK